MQVSGGSGEALRCPTDISPYPGEEGQNDPLHGTCSRLAGEDGAPSGNPVTPSLATNMERNFDEFAPATPTASDPAPVERRRSLARLVMIGLALFLLEWNIFLLVYLFETMPRNDF